MWDIAAAFPNPCSTHLCSNSEALRRYEKKCSKFHGRISNAQALYHIKLIRYKISEKKLLKMNAE